MNKIVIAGGAGLIVVALAGAGWAVFGRAGDPVQAARASLQKGDLRTASIQLRGAVRDQPENAQAHLLLAQAQMLGGDAVAAEKEARSARDLQADAVAVAAVLGQAEAAQAKWKDLLSDVPDHAPSPDGTAVLLVLRATAQAALGDQAAAKASLAKAQDDAPQSPEVRIAAARIAAGQRDLGLADTKLDEALAIAPNRADALVMKAQIASARRDAAGSIALMDKAVAAAPDSLAYKLDRANLLLNVNKDDLARADVDAVLAKDPRNYGAQFLRMALLVRAGKYTEADPLLLGLDPVIANLPRGLYFAAMVKTGLNQLAQAEDLARRYVARTPADRDGARLLARILIAEKKPDDAATVLRAAVTDGKPDPETLDLMGRIYATQGKTGDAAAAFQQASTLAPQSTDILARLASARMQLGDTAGANAALEQAQQAAPNQANVSGALVATAIGAGDLDRAQSLLDALQKQAGDTEQVGLLTGVLALARLDTEGARAAFEANLHRFPDSTSSKIDLAKVMLLQNRPGEAIDTLKQILAKAPANAEALSLAAQTLVREKRGPEAMALAEAARVAAPGNLGIVAGEAELALNLGDGARGLALVQSAKPKDGPLAPGLLPLLARAQIVAGKPEDAKASFAQMLDANPADLAARGGLVDLLISIGDVAGAQATLRDGLRAMPGNLILLSSLVQLEQRARGLDAALSLADRLQADPAQLPAAAVLRGDLLTGARRFAEAQTAYATAFKTAPNALLALRMAQADVSDGKPDRAYANLRAFQATQPDDLAVAQTLGSLDVAAKRYPEAEKNLQAVLKSRPNDPVALNNLAWAYQAQKDPRARALAQRAYVQAPSPELADTLGWIMVSQGDAPRALPLLQQASAQRPNDHSIRFHLAAALKTVGRGPDAIAILRPLVDDPAEFEEKPDARQMLAELGAAK